MARENIVQEGALQDTNRRQINSNFTELYPAGVAATAATLTMTNANHANKTVILDRAAGVTVTLPAATGSGSIYRFFVKTAVTSNNDIIRVANSTDVMQGRSYQIGATGACTAFATVAASDTITFNGTTTGGLRGDSVIIQDLEAGLFSVLVFSNHTSASATPFSATV